jgi:LPXTG-motif cell wall-anchored protein
MQTLSDLWRKPHRRKKGMGDVSIDAGTAVEDDASDDNGIDDPGDVSGGTSIDPGTNDDLQGDDYSVGNSLNGGGGLSQSNSATTPSAPANVPSGPAAAPGTAGAGGAAGGATQPGTQPAPSGSGTLLLVGGLVLVAGAAVVIVKKRKKRTNPRRRRR